MIAYYIYANPEVSKTLFQYRMGITNVACISAVKGFAGINEENEKIICGPDLIKGGTA